MKKIIFAAAALGLLSATAQAADVGVSAGLGTTGFGFHVAVPVQQQVNARFGVNAFNYSYNGKAENVDYDFKLKLQTFDALLDWYPTAGSFRVTGGAVYNGNKITVTGKPSAGSSYTINGQTYTSSEVGSLNGKIDFRKAAPYLGIGWGDSIVNTKRGFGFTADIGVLFQGAPRTTLTASCGAGSQAVCAEIDRNVAAETARVNEEAKDFKAYPVLRFGVTYRF